MIIISKDSLRTSVEAATQGRNTILYNAKGYPQRMVVIPKFTCDQVDTSVGGDLGTSVHPAFIVNGNVVPEIFIGQFQASVYDGCGLSAPGVEPANTLTRAQAIAYANANGAGWHMMTNAEWAAIALHSLAAGITIHGNTNRGKSYLDASENGIRVDGLNPGDVSGYARVFTGSGPVGWRHDKTPYGISDIVGNVGEMILGYRVINGEIQIIQDNNSADQTLDQSAESTEWKAILVDGSLVAPGTANTMKFDATAAGYTGNVQLDDVLDNDGVGWLSVAFKDIASDVATPGLLKRLAIMPNDIDLIGNISIGCQLSLYPIRGGDYSSGVVAGVWRKYFAEIAASHAAYGFRVAYIPTT